MVELILSVGTIEFTRRAAVPHVVASVQCQLSNTDWSVSQMMG
jgi:hypothetical protein